MAEYHDSQGSQASTIPYEFFDPDFANELEKVDQLFFGNVLNSDNQSVLSDISDDDVNESDNNSDDDLNHSVEMPVHTGDADNAELIRQNTFKTQGCGCVRLYGKSCSSIVDWSELITYRESCLEKTKDELDMIIKIQLYHNLNSGASTERSKVREKNRQNYYFHGQKICRATFAFAHGIVHKTVDRIARSLDTDGLSSRVHGNVGKTPKHALTLLDVQNIRQFLISYGIQNGLPLPGRMSNFRNEKYILLPSDKNKADIHVLYCTAADENDYRKVCLSEFKKILLEQCPYMLIMKPSTDLCLKCQKYIQSIRNSGNLTEEEKLEKLHVYQDHIDKVKCQRDHYRSQCESTKREYADLSVEEKVRGQPPAVSDAHIHYSFDYAQQVLYPHYAQQVGPLYFKTPRKCGCFGVCCESSGSQIFYLVDEEYGTAVGRGANSVVSMVHHHFHHHGYGERNVAFHMDNCTGQNKNNAVIGYGMWRVMSGLHTELEYSLMEAGHTKFSPDWHFGLWKFQPMTLLAYILLHQSLLSKVRWRHSTAETLSDISSTVKESSRGGHNIPQLVNDPERPVVFYDWATFLKQFFKPVPHLKKYHHFRMSSATPGMIFMKEYNNSVETEFNILKLGADLTGKFPSRVEIPGLDASRQWYLFDEIAPLCDNTSVCPRPTVPRPVHLKKEKT